MTTFFGVKLISITLESLRKRAQGLFMTELRTEVVVLGVGDAPEQKRE